MASPLSLMMPVLPGTKLSSLLSTLSTAQPSIDKALEDIGTVHYARFLLFDRSSANLLPDLANVDHSSDTLVISVITNYDGDFDKYIHDFVSQLGMIFDLLLAHVIGGKSLIPVANNIQAFLAFILENDASQQLPNKGSGYQAYSNTVQEILAAFS
jgi:hypothetical protein